MPELLDAFRIKHALKDIGAKNKAYGEIFAYYESLERRLELLERRLAKQTEEMEQQAKAFQQEREETALQIQMIEDEVKAKQQELSEEAAKHAQCRKELRSLRQKYDKLRHSADGQGNSGDGDDGADGDDLLIDKLRAQLDSQQRKAYEERVKLTTDYEKQIKQLKEELELYRGKDGEAFKGDLASLTPAVLKAAAKKNGWNARALPFLLNEEDQDIDTVCRQLKEYKEKLKKLETDTKRKMEQFDGASMVLIHTADFLLNASMSSDDLLVAIAGGDDGKPRVHKIASECKSSNLLGASKELSMLSAKIVERLRMEKDDLLRRGSVDGAGYGSRPGTGDDAELSRLQRENQRLTVALEEMRFRLQKLESLARAQGKDGDLRTLMMESGLDLGGSMQDWALRNVWERLYADAVARHERATTRFLQQQKAYEIEMISKAELYRIIGITLIESPRNEGGEGRQPAMQIERSPRLPGATYELSWESVARKMVGHNPHEDEPLQKASRRVHELIESQGGRVKGGTPEPGGKPIKLGPVAKPKTTKSMPPASWRNLGSSAPVPQARLHSQEMFSKQVVLQGQGKAMAATMSAPDLNGKSLGRIGANAQLVVSGQSRHKGDDTGTRPGTESTRPGTRPGTVGQSRPGTVGGLSTRPGTQPTSDGMRTRPTSEERFRGVPEPDREPPEPAWMPAPLGRTSR